MKIERNKSVYQRQALAVARLSSYIRTKLIDAENAEDSVSKIVWFEKHNELRRKISALDIPQYGNISLLDAFHMGSVERVRSHMEMA